MENEIVVRSEFWKHQLSVKRELYIPITAQDIVYAYQDEMQRFSKQVVVVFEGIYETLKVACEKITETFDKLGCTLSDFADLDKLSDLDIGSDYHCMPVSEKKNKLYKSKVNNLNLASKASIKSFNMQNLRKPNIHCRNNLRK